MEGFRHFYDYDIPHGGDAVLITENYLGKEISVYDTENPESISNYPDGTLPWALADNFNMFVACLEENKWDNAAQLAGVIAHYVGDASMPLHATSDFDTSGNHSTYESKVDSEVRIDNAHDNVSGFVPHEILPRDNIFNAAMQELSESYGFTGYTPDKLNYWLYENIVWNDTIKSITENRLRTATEYLANVWYTGMIEAGLATPTVTRGVNVSISPNSETALHGKMLTYAVTVTNMGNVSDNYILGISDNSSWPLSLDNNMFDNVLDGGVVTTTLRVTIPENAAYGTVDSITVTAKSSDNENVIDNASCIARSATVSCKLSIDPVYLANLPGENSTFTVWVKNTSDDLVFRDNYTLVAGDSLGWQLLIDNIENVLAGENVSKTLTVVIPGGAMIGTKDNILVTAISGENAGLRDNGRCVVSVEVYRGAASIRLKTEGTAPYLYGVYKAYVNVNLLVSGDNLHLKFLKYDNKTVEWDNVIWSRTTPGAENVIIENLIVPHDNQYPIYSPPDYIKRMKLVLTDSAGTVILDNMAWYTVVQDDWGDRISWIVLNWTLHAPSSQDKLGDEISTIVLNWALVPTGPRDQHDFQGS